MAAKFKWLSLLKETDTINRFAGQLIPSWTVATARHCLATVVQWQRATPARFILKSDNVLLKRFKIT